MKNYIIKSKKYGDINVLLDDEDYDRITKEKYSLCATYDKTIKGFYIGFTAKPSGSKSRLLHRYIMKPDDNLTVDHINHNTLDNRKCNLRICTQFENNQNQTANTSGKVGVCYSKKDKVYVAYIRVKGKMIRLGCSKDFNKAVRMRLAGENKYFGGGDVN